MSESINFSKNLYLKKKRLILKLKQKKLFIIKILFWFTEWIVSYLIKFLYINIIGLILLMKK